MHNSGVRNTGSGTTVAILTNAQTGFIADNNLYYGGSGTSLTWGATAYNFTDYKNNSLNYANAASSTLITVTVNNATTPPVVVSVGGGGYGVPYIPGVGLVATTTPFSTPPVTSSMSNADLQALINSLTARLNILLAQARTQSPTITFVFTRDLQLRDTGNDVQMLQQFLNTKGFLVSQTGPGSPGNETTYFGVKTWQALVNFQKNVSIKPASGYFGPITRAYMNAL